MYNDYIYLKRTKYVRRNYDKYDCSYMLGGLDKIILYVARV